MQLSLALSKLGAGIIEKRSDGSFWLIPNPYHRQFLQKGQTPLVAEQIEVSSEEWESMAKGKLRKLPAESEWWCANGETIKNFDASAPNFEGFSGGCLGYVALGLPEGEYYLRHQ